MVITKGKLYLCKFKVAAQRSADRSLQAVSEGRAVSPKPPFVEQEQHGGFGKTALPCDRSVASVNQNAFLANQHEPVVCAHAVSIKPKS